MKVTWSPWAGNGAAHRYPDGTIHASMPLRLDAKTKIVRADVSEDGQMLHLMFAPLDMDDSAPQDGQEKAG